MTQIQIWIERIAKIIIILHVLFIFLTFLGYLTIPNNSVYIRFTEAFLFPINALGSKLFWPSVIILLGMFLWKKRFKNKELTGVNTESDGVLDKVFQVAATTAIFWIMTFFLGVALWVWGIAHSNLAP